MSKAYRQTTQTGRASPCCVRVPFVTANATSLAQSKYVNEAIEALLQRLLEKAYGDMAKAQRGIVFIDEIDKLKASEGEQRGTSGERVQRALLTIMKGAAVRRPSGRIRSTSVLQISFQQGARDLRHSGAGDRPSVADRK